MNQKNCLFDRPQTLKSKILPFCVSRPDFIEYTSPDLKRNPYLIKIISSDDVEYLQLKLQRKDEKVEKQFLTCLTIFEANRGKVVTILQPKNIFLQTPNFRWVEYNVEEDYLKANQKELSQKYFSNVLLPYFNWQFRIKFRHKKAVALEFWFIKRVQAYSEGFNGELNTQRNKNTTRSERAQKHSVIRL